MSNPKFFRLEGRSERQRNERIAFRRFTRWRWETEFQPIKGRAIAMSWLTAETPLLFSSLLKASLQGKPCHHRVQDETADASALSLSSSFNPRRFLSAAANQQDRTVWVSSSLFVVWRVHMLSYDTIRPILTFDDFGLKKVLQCINHFDDRGRSVQGSHARTSFAG